MNTEINRLINRLLLFLLLSPLLNFLLVRAVKIQAIYLITLISYPLLVFVFFEKKKLIIPRYLRYLAIFIIYSLILNVIKTDFVLNVKILYSLSFIGFFVIALVIENTQITKDFIQKSLRYGKLIILISFLVVLIQATVNPFFLINPLWQSEPGMAAIFYERLTSIFSWTSQLSAGLDFIPILIVIIATDISFNSKKLWIWFVIGTIFAFLTRSRWIMINYLALFAIFPLYFRTKIGRYFGGLIGLLTVLVFSFIILQQVGIDVAETFENRIFEKQAGGLTEGSASTRILAFVVFFDLFPNNPVWGTGVDFSYELVTSLGGRSSQIHVGYLSLLFFYGIVGSVLYLSFLINLIKRLYRNARTLNLWGPFLGWLGFVLANFTLVYLGPFMMGLLICLAFNKYYEQEIVNSKIITAIK